MAKMGLVENPAKRRKRRRARNPVAAKVAKKNPARRRTTNLATVKSVAKRNGYKLAKIGSVSNPKRRRKHHKRRNGLSTVSRRNGLLGNTKADAKQVGTILAGAAATKMLGKILNSFLSPYLAQVGVGAYSEIVTNAGAALFVIPFLATKFVRGGDVAKNARIGGLLVVGLDVINQFFPSVMGYSPFNTSPVVLTANGPAITPAAAAQLAAGVAQSNNPVAAAAAVGHAMGQLQNGGGMGGAYQDTVSGNIDMEL